MQRHLNSHNKPIVKLLHTSEKIKRRNGTLALKMDRMLDRVTLDRNFIIKEKIQCILGPTHKNAKDDASIKKLSE